MRKIIFILCFGLVTSISFCQVNDTPDVKIPNEEYASYTYDQALQIDILTYHYSDL